MIDIDVITAGGLVKELDKQLKRSEEVQDLMMDLIGHGIIGRGKLVSQDLAFDSCMNFAQHWLHASRAITALSDIIYSCKA